jgi:hypothetical protein
MRPWPRLTALLMLAFASLRASTDATVCASCHPAEAGESTQSAMGRALLWPADAPALRGGSRLTFSRDAYDYEIEPRGERSVYSVSRAGQAISARILWAVGAGVAGQTYLLEYQGEWYESRLTYYSSTRGLDVTVGLSFQPHSLTEALGVKLTVSDKQACLRCHATAYGTKAFSPGIGCDLCHGSGAAHAEAALAGRRAVAMPSLKRQSTERQLGLCGECHRSWELVVSMRLKPIETIRFEPYRLTNSRCYSATDRRIACTSCHDPHTGVQKDVAYYDAMCLACHGPGSGQTCPKARHSCTGCHMPKLELPGSHFKFTDHQIRVVRPGETLPK